MTRNLHESIESLPADNLMPTREHRERTSGGLGGSIATGEVQCQTVLLLLFFAWIAKTNGNNVMITYDLLRTTYYSLLTTYYLLLTTYYLLLTTYPLLLTER